MVASAFVLMVWFIQPLQKTFAANGKLADYTHNAVVEFPALYPFFLSGFMLLTGLKPLVFAPILNALLFAVVIYLSGYIMEQFSYPSKWYKRAVLSCIVLSPGLLEVYSMVWSETLFILWLLLFMMANAPLFSIIFPEGIDCRSRNSFISFRNTICRSYNHWNRRNVITAGYETSIAKKADGSVIIFGNKPFAIDH